VGFGMTGADLPLLTGLGLGYAVARNLVVL